MVDDTPLAYERARGLLLVACLCFAFARLSALCDGATRMGQAANERDAPLAVDERQKVDLNCASVSELQSLPGAGPALAGRVVEERSNVLFGDIDELIRVRGVGPARLESWRPLLRASVNCRRAGSGEAQH